MAKRRRVSRWIVATLTLIAIRVSGAIPFSWTKYLGKFFGLAAYYFVPRIRKIGMANLDLAYGDSLSIAEKRRILKKSAQNIATVGARFAQVPKFYDYTGGPPFQTRGEELVDIEGGGVLITAHLGNWEYMGIIGKPYGMHAGGVVRPFDDPRVDAVVDGIRRSGGFDTIEKDAAGTKLLKMIKDGHYVLILIDQSPRDNAVPTTFFGQPCWSTFAPAMIAIRSKAPIYPVFAVQEPGGLYTMYARPRIEWKRTGDMRKDLVIITQKC